MPTARQVGRRLREAAERERFAASLDDSNFYDPASGTRGAGDLPATMPSGLQENLAKGLAPQPPLVEFLLEFYAQEQAAAQRQQAQQAQQAARRAPPEDDDIDAALARMAGMGLDVSPPPAPPPTMSANRLPGGQGEAFIQMAGDPVVNYIGSEEYGSRLLQQLAQERAAAPRPSTLRPSEVMSDGTSLYGAHRDMREGVRAAGRKARQEPLLQALSQEATLDVMNSPYAGLPLGADDAAHVERMTRLRGAVGEGVVEDPSSPSGLRRFGLNDYRNAVLGDDNYIGSVPAKEIPLETRLVRRAGLVNTSPQERVALLGQAGNIRQSENSARGEAAKAQAAAINRAAEKDSERALQRERFNEEKRQFAITTGLDETRLLKDIVGMKASATTEAEKAKADAASKAMSDIRGLLNLKLSRQQKLLEELQLTTEAGQPTLEGGTRQPEAFQAIVRAALRRDPILRDVDAQIEALKGSLEGSGIDFARARANQGGSASRDYIEDLYLSGGRR